MMTKGQIEVTFNWLFVMLAGGAILFFFYNVINFEIDSTDAQIDRTVSERVRSIFTSLGSTSNSFQVQDGFSSLLEFTCEEGVHRFGISGASSTVDLRNQLVFTPPFLGEGDLLTATNSLEIPFDVGNLVYIADRSTRYVFVDGAVGENNFEEHFETSNIRSDDISQLNEGGYRLTVFVVDNSFESSTEMDNLDFDYEIVNIDSFDSELKFNNELFRKGYILSAGTENYGCVEDKIFDQIKISSFIYANRTQEVFTESSNYCRGIMGSYDINAILNNYIDGNIDDEKVNTLRDANNALDRGGCDWIY